MQIVIVVILLSMEFWVCRVRRAMQGIPRGALITVERLGAHAGRAAILERGR